MEELHSEFLPVATVGLFEKKVRKCIYCGDDIPSYRTRKAKYCRDSCKQMQYELNNAQKLVTEDAEAFPEQIENKEEALLQENGNLQNIVQEKNHETEKELDHWESATEDEKNKLRYNCRMVSEIEKHVKYYKNHQIFEIPINRIHSLLPSKTPIASVEKIALRNCTLKLCSDKSKYLICTNK